MARTAQADERLHPESPVQGHPAATVRPRVGRVIGGLSCRFSTDVRVASDKLRHFDVRTGGSSQLAFAEVADVAREGLLA